MGFAVSGSRSWPPAAALAIPAPEVGAYAVAVRDGIVPRDYERDPTALVLP